MINTNIKRVIQVIVILVILIFFFHACKNTIKPAIINGLGGYTDTEYKIHTDTLKSTFDSIYFKYDSLQTVIYRLGKQKVITDFKTQIVYKDRKDTNTKVSSKGNTSALSTFLTSTDTIYASVFEQVNAFSDTLNEGTVTSYVNPSDCKIIAQTLCYKPKNPILVRETKNVITTKETTLTNKPRGLIGFGGAIDSNKNLGISGAYMFPNKLQIQGSYLWNTETKNPVTKAYQNEALFKDKVVAISIIKFF
jgi:hypothetical protein